MTIQVTQEDIEGGVPRDGCLCPIARSIKRALKTGLVEVDTDRVQLYADARVPLPDKAQVFISLFDDDRPVEPFEFELPIEATP
jgi:hypothetical protein